MDAGLDSSKYELESITSTNEFRSNHLATPDETNIDLSKRIALLELDNEHLRIDLENLKIELNAKNAANQGLKNKIAELYIEACISMQEKQKLHNSAIDIQCHLAAAKNSLEWYQRQLHDAQANNKILQIEIDTYESMLKKKHQTLININAKWKQLNEDFLIFIQKHKNEKDILQAEITSLKINNNSIKTCRAVLSDLEESTVSIAIHKSVSNKLESMEEELVVARTELRKLEQRLIGSEIEKASMECTFDKQQTLLSTVENSLQRCQNEKEEIAETACELRLQLQEMNSQSDIQQIHLMQIRQEREQVEDAIEKLRSQLTKMIVQYKLLKSRNVELEEKLNAVQAIYNENKRLKSLSYSANASLFRRLRQEKKKTNDLEIQLYQERNKQRVLINDLKNQLKFTKMSEDNLDEGYADGSISSFAVASLPSPNLINPELLITINDILSKSENFWEPIQIELNKLYLKFENYKGEKIHQPNNCHNIPSLSNNDQSVF
ncbi:PREDICTED: spindle pole body protein pcp1-like [Ceratosolen solmsi marchali]|uniref:Spindle pole body protein pcp1-like n=1 Tax=Ceratosolen solmsi marchali TaxID=326594 RepID=A0AAJ7DX86_9HYME|nr:PREDICTED: spindle pole body protein pcp1-like [Ceratosolen solmsi marchali]